ncbi:MAG: hypothetical protein ACI8XV_002652 [Arenicella sp.]|jgi:hypothetical protein
MVRFVRAIFMSGSSIIIIGADPGLAFQKFNRDNYHKPD